MEDIWGEILQGILRPNLLKISDFVVASRLGQNMNAIEPISLILGGIVIEIRFSQPKNAEYPIVLTLGGIVQDVAVEQKAISSPFSTSISAPFSYLK